jgi:cellulose synthase/poly-beta-1,6-N-acetylglucosamine synthase-like glycosyltransferase
MPPLLSVLIQGLLVFTAAYATVGVCYYVGLAASYFLVRERPHPSAGHLTRFAVVIPAHNEELVLDGALRSWFAVDYPRDRFAIYVIADNCSDATAKIACSHQAICLVREDAENRGKGQALAWALTMIPLAECDAVVFVDADCAVSKAFLTVMNSRLVEGSTVIQGFDGVLNPDESMLTRLMHITNVMKNRLFMHAKAKLGLSVQLMGTGMCFERSVLQEMPWKAFSVGEDLEQSTYLARSRIKVDYEPAAIAYAQEASSFRQAYSQRIRWASSRMSLFRTGIRLLGDGLWNRDLHRFDAGLSLVVPNYALLANVTIVGLLVALLLGTPYVTLWLGLLLGAELGYFALGVAVSGLTARSLASLSIAPIFLVWKAFVDAVAMLRMKRLAWTRTERVPHTAVRRPLTSKRGRAWS